MTKHEVGGSFDKEGHRFAMPVECVKTRDPLFPVRIDQSIYLKMLAFKGKNQ